MTQEKEVSTSRTSAGLTLQQRAHVVVNGLGAASWFWIIVMVLYQWFLVDQGVWKGLPAGLQTCVDGVVLYSAILDTSMHYTEDLLLCVQTLIRLFVLFGIITLFPSIQSLKIYYPCLLFVWATQHVVRYSYDAYQKLSDFPSLVHARFAWPLYLAPLGVVLEIMMMYTALPLAKEWNRTYGLMMAFGGLAYLPGFPVLYKNVLIERRRYIQRLFLEKNK
ncbi:tyrosine phosphatase-like protein [Halteromyces radiatus]|uniref:tyrosine phosphatase-like protein n=1 Tax=Halteromyces radiatus TaxID=101107 RepID=UPI002220DAE8|nr:tyrosine phosphatase-like protein [Halteromyces radiatus]KAI8082846.1 tyrosine phosphatase-like protein [Halteromyces radiatus]